MKQLTKRQLEITDFIENFIRENNFAPSLRDIANNFGFSPKAAKDHLTALKNKGVIKTTDNLSRSISLMKKNPGDSALAVIKVPFKDSDSDFIPVTQGLLNISDSDSVYAAVVHSDSMKDAGILPGDIAILLDTKKAANGDIVFAAIGDDDDYELKYFYSNGNKYELRSANSSYSSKVSNYCDICGRLLLIIKRY